MTAVCAFCECPLERADSKQYGVCLECRVVIANENTTSLSERRRRVVAARLAELEAGVGEA